MLSALDSQYLMIWNNSVGVSRTATVRFLHDNSSSLANNEIFAELQYLSNASYPLTSVASNKVALFPFNTGATACPLDTTSQWVTTGITNPKLQQIDITFTPQMAGLVMLRIYLARASYTV
jgi:hypothetical protein